jgi:hypothetical protein
MAEWQLLEDHGAVQPSEQVRQFIEKSLEWRQSWQLVPEHVRPVGPQLGDAR